MPVERPFFVEVFYQVDEEVLQHGHYYKEDDALADAPTLGCFELGNVVRGAIVETLTAFAQGTRFFGVQVTAPTFENSGPTRFCWPLDVVTTATAATFLTDSIVANVIFEGTRTDGKRSRGGFKLSGAATPQINGNTWTPQYIQFVQDYIDAVWPNSIAVAGRNYFLCNRSENKDGVVEYPLVTRRGVSGVKGIMKTRVGNRTERRSASTTPPPP